MKMSMSEFIGACVSASGVFSFDESLEEMYDRVNYKGRKCPEYTYMNALPHYRCESIYFIVFACLSVHTILYLERVSK